MVATPDPAGGTNAVDELNAEGLVICGSPSYPESLEHRMSIAKRRRERNYNPGGVTRQMAAVVAFGSRIELLEGITLPSLVIHGEDDPLIPIAAGRDTADSISGSQFEAIAGMGHNIPAGVIPILVPMIVNFCRRNTQ